MGLIGGTMNNPLLDLLLNGFMIYPSNGKFVVKKENVPNSPYKINEKEFDDYASAINHATQLLIAPRLTAWSVVLRYNRGLGIEYKNLSDVFATTKDEAVIMANNQVEVLSKTIKLLSFEIKVRLKNDS